jgi:hypothetical protein
MTIAWHDGKFYREQIEDDYRRAQIAILEAHAPRLRNFVSCTRSFYRMTCQTRWSRYRV